jgi:alpha-1,2-mannosyltransferase
MVLNNYKNVGSDFAQDYIAAHSIRDGNSLYSPKITKKANEMLGFRGIENFHPPFNAFLFFPLSFFSYKKAYLVLGIISIILLCLINQLIVKGLELNRGWFLNFLCFTACWYPVINCLGAGQSSMIITACLVIGWFCLRNYREYTAGFFFAVATLMKLFPGLILLYLLIMKNWRAFFATVSFLAFGLILITFTIGIDDIRTYAIIMVAKDIDVYRGYVFNHSMGGIVSKVFGKRMGWFEPLVELPQFSSWLIMLLSIAILIFTILKLKKMAERQGLADYAFSLTLVTMLLLSPLTWSHIFPVLILPIGLLLRDYIFEPSSQKLLTVLIILACLSLPDVLIARAILSIYYPLKMPLFGLIMILGPGVGLVLLWVVLCLRTRISFNFS